MKWKSILGAAVLSVAFVAPARADVVGTLNIDGGVNGVTVGLTTIDFGPPGGGTGNFVVSAFTNVTYGPGGVFTVDPGDPGVIKDLSTSTSLPLDRFMSFPLDPLVDYSLSGLGPGSANTNCAGLTVVGQSCSPFVGSPFILTLTQDVFGVLGTGVSLAASGLAFDTFSVSTWTGGFTTQFPGETPAQLQAVFGCTTGSTGATGANPCTNPNATISSSYSGTFRAVATPVPEPASLSLLGLGLLGVAARARKRWLS